MPYHKGALAHYDFTCPDDPEHVTKKLSVPMDLTLLLLPDGGRYVIRAHVEDDDNRGVVIAIELPKPVEASRHYAEASFYKIVGDIRHDDFRLRLHTLKLPRFEFPSLPRHQP